MRLNVDDRLIINFIVDGDPIKRAFRVSGIYKTGLGEYDRRFVIVDMRILQDVLGWTTNQISGLEIHLDEWQDMDVFTEYIYFELLPGRLYAESARQKFYQIFEWLELQNINERVLIILMVLVAMINMITALMIFVLERTKMIGILKALGTQNWTIRQIFLYHALRIIAYGMIIGNALALLFCYVQMRTGVLKLSEADYYLDRVPIEFNWLSMLLINAGTVVIVLLFLIVPTRIISGISPVKTIQFK
ncbi:MAG: FtsX-like permease family protein, partial [Bacteroidota bacterium]